MTRPDALSVWLYGTEAARLTDDGDGRLGMEWTRDALSRWGEGSRVMSCLIPVSGERPHPRKAAVYFDGLLAEGNTRTHMAIAAGVNPEDIYGILANFGRDTAGAVSVAEAGADDPETGGWTEPIGESDVADLLANEAANHHDFGQGDTWQSRSLAGLRPKIALVQGADGQWARGHRGYPTTHILKPGAPRRSPAYDIIYTEAACSDIALHAGIGHARSEVRAFGGVAALVVPRFDRYRDESGHIRRIHHEDAAQALGINTRDPERKFQRGRTLPSLKAIAGAVRQMGGKVDYLVTLTALNLVVGNTDAHAKNISILHGPDGYGGLAPTYDISMHLHHRSADRDFAMDVAGARGMDTITAADLVGEVSSWDVTNRRAQRLVDEAIDRVAQALNAVDQDAHPGVPPNAWSVVKGRAKSLTSGLARTRAADTGGMGGKGGTGGAEHSGP